jgi:hypothetical protein
MLIRDLFLEHQECLKFLKINLEVTDNEQNNLFSDCSNDQNIKASSVLVSSDLTLLAFHLQVLIMQISKS